MHLGTTAPISVLFDSFYQGRAVDGNDGEQEMGLMRRRSCIHTSEPPPFFYSSILFPPFYQVELASEISVGVLSKEREKWFLP